MPWADLSQDPDARAWRMTLVDYVVIGRATPGNRFDPDRVTIEWREGVESRD